VGAAIDGVVRDRINRGALPGPRVLTSLRQITNRSGDPDALRALVRQTKQEGADLIKLFATSGLGAGGDQTMTDAQIEAVCSEATAQGLRTLVHAIGDTGARAAVLAGCTSIEHGGF
jgi:imidazolonepropionase-like amidohydrolase